MSIRKKILNKKKANKTKVKSKFNLSLNSFFLIAIPVFCIGTSVARYVYHKNADLVYEAMSFYFESDLLFDNTNPVAYIYDVGNDKITFKLKNNEDDLRCSEVDIEYEVYITDIHGNSVIDKNGNSIESLKGTLKKDVIDTDELSFENLPEGNYIITAEATKPYTKKIQGSFSLKESKEEIEYWINDSVGSPLVLLTVNTQDFEGNCSIKWKDGLAPDVTDEKFSNINSGYNQGECVIEVNSNSEYTFQFFKSNPNVVFSKDDFEVGRSS